MTNHTITDYGCPECGYDGPHTIMETEDDVVTVECDSCYILFDIDLNEE
jgi:hypothetical protein